MIKKVIIGVILFLLTISLSGCFENRDSRFVGTWEYKNWPGDFPTMKLYSNGRGYVGDDYVTWEIDGADCLVFNRESKESKPRVYYYSFSNDGKELTLTVPGTGVTRDYIKQ